MSHNFLHNLPPLRRLRPLGLLAALALVSPAWAEHTTCRCAGGAHRNANCPHATSAAFPRLTAARKNSKAHLQATHWGYPENFCELPLNTYRSAMLQTQILNGWNDRLVLYHYDFYPVSSPLAHKLNPKGLEVLTQLGPLLADVSGELKIQPTGNADVDEARRSEVIERLAELGFTPPAEAIVLGVPASRALSGQEAPLIFGSMFSAVGAGSVGTSQPSTGGAIPVAPQPTTPR